MSAEGHVIEKSYSSKSLIRYILVLAVFVGALWLSFQNDGPSKFPKQITDEFGKRRSLCGSARWQENI